MPEPIVECEAEAVEPKAPTKKSVEFGDWDSGFGRLEGLEQKGRGFG